MADSRSTLGAVLEKMGLRSDASLEHTTFNGNVLEDVYPWGTIKKTTPAVNKATAESLTASEREEIRRLTWQYLQPLDYTSYM
jgi:hypothetical protein